MMTRRRYTRSKFQSRGRRRLPRVAALSLWASLAWLLLSQALAVPRDARALRQDAGQSQAERFRLAPGETNERELSVGASHSYLVALSAGEFMRLRVEQKGTDVTLQMFGLNSQPLFKLDSPNGTHGSETLWFVSEAAGEYRLEITAGERENAASRYAVKLEEARAATAEDARRLAGQQLWADGLQLRLERTAAARRTMLGLFQQALVIFRELGERQAEAKALHEIGFLQWALNEFQPSIGNYTAAVALHRAVGDRSAEAYALDGIAIVYDYMGDKETALEFYQQALRLHQELGNGQGEGQSFNGLGAVYKQFGDWQRAIFYYSQARTLYRAAGNTVAEAVALNNLGQCYMYLGDYQQALALLEKSLALRGKKNPRGRAATINNIGSIYASLGDAPKALDYYRRALPLWQEAGDRRGAANTLHLLANLYKTSGDRERALENYRQALQTFREVKDRFGEAMALDSLGLLAHEAQENEEALSELRGALALRRAIKDRYGEAQTLQHLAGVHLAHRRLTEARTDIEAALAIVETLRAGIAGPELRASYLATVQQYYELYIDVLMELHRREPEAGHDALALLVSERARARGLLDLLQESRLDIRQGVSPALLKRERLLGDQLSLQAEKQTTLLRGAHSPEDAAAIAREIETLAAEYRKVKAEIRRTSPRYVALTEPRILGLAEIQREALDDETLLLEYKLGEHQSYLWAVTRTGLDSYELPARAKIERAARRVYQLLTARNLRPGGESAAQRQARLAEAEKEYTVAAKELSRILLSPVASALGDRKLVIVGDGALLYIPFAALPDPANGGGGEDATQPLMVRHQIVNLPSASTIAALRRERAARPVPGKTVAVLADPVFDKDDVRLGAHKGRGGEAMTNKSRTRAVSLTDEAADTLLGGAVRDFEETLETSLVPRLPFSRREAAAILAATTEAEGMLALDFAASRETAMSDALAGFRFIHFATHGLLNSRHPELSGLVFSLIDEKGQAQNGYLRLHEIYNLELPAELVVLSACRTGLGKEVRGEGLVGLTRGFMYAGATRVAASLWQVDDAATAELMGHFYQNMLGKRLPPAAALREAQVRLWRQRRWQSPYYWAAFVLQGEWK